MLDDGRKKLNKLKRVWTHPENLGGGKKDSREHRKRYKVVIGRGKPSGGQWPWPKHKGTPWAPKERPGLGFVKPTRTENNRTHGKQKSVLREKPQREM